MTPPLSPALPRKGGGSRPFVWRSSVSQISISRYIFAFSRRVAPEVCWRLPALSNQRAQGRPGARCTRGLVCICGRKCAHEHTGSAGASRPSLRNGFTAYNVISPAGRARCHRRRRNCFHQLDASLGRQDHTSLPYAQAARVSRSLRVHRNPPLVVTTADAPLSGTGWP